MKNTLLLISLVLGLSFSPIVSSKGKGGGHVSVSGYVKRDGTVVQPHHRTSPDSVKTNNWSYSGNINPYTGKIGTSLNDSPNFRGSTIISSNQTVGYVQNLPSNVTNINLPNGYYILKDGELHNPKTASFYTD